MCNRLRNIINFEMIDQKLKKINQVSFTQKMI